MIKGSYIFYSKITLLLKMELRNVNKVYKLIHFPELNYENIFSHVCK